MAIRSSRVGSLRISVNGDVRSGLSGGIDGSSRQLVEALKPGATVEVIVEALASPQRQGRATLLSRLRERGPSVYRSLLVLMVDSRLAVRAAAGEALAHLTGAGLEFDPFADVTVRRAQINQWTGWLDEPKPNPRTARPPSPRFTRATP